MDRTKQHLFLEAQVKPTDPDSFTGKEWDVTIIGARKAEQAVTVDGREYIRSDNGRLYAVDKIEESAPLWDGVKVFDDHLTQEEFEARQGMRSPKNEWLGSLVKPRFVRENGLPQLRAIFKVVEDALATKLKNAWEQGVLDTIGLSIDTFPIVGGEAQLEGERLPVVEGFKKILSVDLVGNPAAGGGFNRLIAAAVEESNDMDEEAIAALLDEKLGAFKDDLPALVETQVQDTLAEALDAEDVEEPADEGEPTPEVEPAEEDEPEAGEAEQPDGDDDVDEAQQARHEARLARSELMLERKLGKANLPEKFEDMIRATFEGKVFEEEELDSMIDRMKEAHASVDPTGRVTENGQGRSEIEVGLDGDDKFALELQRLIMGNQRFRTLDQNDDDHVKERVQEAGVYDEWVNAGRPNTGRYAKLSHLFYDRFGGDILMDPRAYEAATTSSLATVVKDTVNIMVAADYSKRERWYETIVNTEEVDTIDDATLARVFGTEILSVVPEGGAYTELALDDDEETATFVKKGNFIGITLETLMKDKINYVRRIPRILSNSWYNTLSDLVSNVFTNNSGIGPTLGDTGALFNATALTTGGGHANLLTTALSYSAYGSARDAMRKQTDQKLGAGRRLLIEPRYLLVPVDLETTANEIRNSELVPEADASSTTGNQTRNQFQGQFEVVVVPDWTDANDWALVGDPNMFPAIWLIFPRGQRTPQLFTADSETAGAMFTNDEIRYKIRQMTFRFSDSEDCAPVGDFRPLHKSNVA